VCVGRVCDWFGPIDAGAARRAMYKTLDEPWFHGDVPTADAQRLLASQPIGAFLVRFSNQARGYFTITRRAENRAVRTLVFVFVFCCLALLFCWLSSSAYSRVVL
jgi:hypothetical protein